MSTLSVNNITPANPGSESYFLAKAWVNFNGVGTVAIRGDGGVSSITDLGTGYYIVNFTYAMPDVNYAVIGGTTQGDASQSTSYLDGLFTFFYLTTSVRIQTANDTSSTSSLTDMEIINLAMFR